MNPKELMIGDWVSHKGIPCTVVEVAYTHLYVESDNKIFLAQIEKFTPIPLTDKILEKNGLFEPEILNGYWMITNKDGSFEIEDHCAMKLRYVHELQHALRLCGIDKDIIL